MHSPNAGLLLHEKSKMRTSKGGLWLAVLVGVKREFDFVGFAAQVVAFNRHVELAVGAGIFDGQQRGTGFKGQFPGRNLNGNTFTLAAESHAIEQWCTCDC